MANPRALSGSFNFRVDSPPVPNAPFFPFLGTYTLFPDAIIHIAFSGEIILPSGDWEIGLVQNVWNDRVTIEYSKGGEIYFSNDTHPLLDITNDALLRNPDQFWLDTLGNGFTSLINRSQADMKFRISLDAGDTPTSPPIPANNTRCNGTITENLVFAERATQLMSALVAMNKADKSITTLAATAGNPYGFMWRLEPTPGQPNFFRFKPFFPTAIEMQPPFSLFGPTGVVTSRPTANEFGNQLAAAALVNYLNDCEERPPRQGDANLWP